MDYQKTRKNHFSSYGNQKKRKQLMIDVGMRGFLCTCNLREGDCIRDAYRLLNAFSDADSTVNKDAVSQPINDEKNTSSENNPVTAEDDEEDISTALSKEINELRAESTKPFLSRKFQAVDTGVKNVIFIKSTVPKPLDIVTKIIENLSNTKNQQSRYLLRLLPIEGICKAKIDDIKALANTIFEKYFAQEPKTFAIIFNRHCNNVVQREEIITTLADVITEKNPGNKANLKDPELGVVIEVVRNVCLISIAPYYFKYKKYNLLELCNDKENNKNLDEEKPSLTMETTDEIQLKSTTDIDSSEEAVAKETETNDSSPSAEPAISE